MTQASDAGATVFVLFGATGDLAKRMVLPAFFQLAQHDLLPKKWLLVGNGRGDVSHDDFRQHVSEVLTEFGPAPEGDVWDAFSKNLRFAGGGFDKSTPGSLLDVLADAKDDIGDDAQYIHYLAVPPSAFIPITEGLGEHKLAEGSRVVYEKPFGTSPDNFTELDDAVHAVLDESQVFRIDHFLGKEGSQNLHALRFGNGLFDGVWNREHIRAMQIDVPETLDIDDRAEFYDATGAFLDMIVTHLFQLAAEIAMEPPVSMKPDDVQAARESVISAFRPLAKDDVVFGQFDGYTETEGVASDSTMDTFVAARLWIDTDRWRDVPFLLRTGKQLAASEQRVNIIFRKPASGPLSHDAPVAGNVLSIDLTGGGAIDLKLVVKQPGAEFELATAVASLPLAHVEDADPLPPYVKLINDVILGDRSLFTRPDGLASAWAAIAPILDDRPDVEKYARGSWGPASATELAAPDGWLLGQ
ncbi:glucose-6-phosphate dehydrogenase (NADP(+)) [Glaciihabitans sp. dw_435]|uniref:glucose-6-phosphate dehydrogenase n=1 Tax=Glaciihabitans sp. dw_435 TaxID=2720081 RepID=UPI001BD2745F|nr:glucose-6-phosphate dehydrogenase (NADP(+)) [Glaciihabitans sp. dw_435]